MNVRAFVRNVTDFARLASMPSLFIPSDDARSADMPREMDKAPFRTARIFCSTTKRQFPIKSDSGLRQFGDVPARNDGPVRITFQLCDERELRCGHSRSRT